MELNKNLRNEYPFPPHYIEFSDTTTKGAKLHYVDEGNPSDEVILMLHGNPTWSFFYRNLIKHFSKNNYRTIAPDHIGCGLSSKPQDYAYTLEQHIKNTISLIEKLQLKEINLIVHDWGGAIGMGVATRRPDLIKRIVAMNTAAFLSNEIPWRINVLKNPLGEWAIRTFNAFSYPATFMAVEKPLSKVVKDGFIYPYNNYTNRIATAKFVQDIPLTKDHPSYKTLFEIQESLVKLKCPVLLLWGAKDFCFTLNFQKKWQEFFPQAQSKIFSDAGHYVVEDKTQEVIDEINLFLKRV